MSEPRGPMQRTAVLEEMLRTLPPEVSAQVEEIEREQRPAVKAKPSLQRSATSMNVHEPGGLQTGAPSDITLQKRCTSLEVQLDKWVSIAQLLASELAYREKRLWDWQLDNTNTKAILQKFKDRLKKSGPDKSSGDGKRRSPLAMPAATQEREIGRDGAVMHEVGTPRQIPTSASGIAMLIVEADESHAKALTQTCRDIGYLVTTVSSGEEALDKVYSQHRGGSNQGVIELVLCDVELPGIPGVEVLNHLRSNLQHSDISIIMLASVRPPPTPTPPRWSRPPQPRAPGDGPSGRWSLGAMVPRRAPRECAGSTRNIARVVSDARRARASSLPPAPCPLPPFRSSVRCFLWVCVPAGDGGQRGGDGGAVHRRGGGLVHPEARGSQGADRAVGLRRAPAAARRRAD